MKNLFRTSFVFLAALLLSATTIAQEQPVSWKFSSRQVEGAKYEIVFEASIAHPWHMYDSKNYEGGPNPTSVTFTSIEGAKLVGGFTMLDKPIKVHDPNFDMEIGYFEGRARFAQALTITAAKAVIKGTVEWMACNDENCLPPDEKDFEITITAAPGVLQKAAAPAKEEQPAATTVAGEEAPADSTATDTAVIAPAEPQTIEAPAEETGKGMWGKILEAVLWGFAALLTPCVFPMVPMTVSFFMKGSENKARGRFNASLYGIFIVALYTLPIAVIIAVTNIIGGEAVTADIFNWLATHWIPNVIFFLVFMIFAASFFGAFEITLPSWMVKKRDRQADRGGLVGVFFMALTLVLVSFSCTGPIVGSVLIQSTAGDVWEPVFTMLAFSIAFALPFTLFALFPSLLTNLPKCGGWLISVNVVLGFIEVALGFKFLSVADQTYHWGILDREIYLAIWIVVFSLLGAYLLGKLRFKHDSETNHVGVGRLFLSIAVLSFVVYLVPGMFGAPLKGIAGYLPPMSTHDFVLGSGAPAAAQEEQAPHVKVKYGDFLHLPHGLEGYFEYEEGMAYARKTGKPVLLDFTGHGCVNCREMEARVWSAPEVLEILRRDYVIISLYSDDKKVLPQSDWVVTDNGKTLKSLGKINSYFARTRFNANAQPFYILLDNDGKPLLPPRGYNLDVEAYADFLRKGVEAYKAKQQ